jgi:hypothetical protein
MKLSSTREENVDELFVLSPHCYLKGRHVGRVPSINICSVIHEEFESTCTSEAYSDVEGSCAGAVARVHVCASLD